MSLDFSQTEQRSALTGLAKVHAGQRHDEGSPLIERLRLVRSPTPVVFEPSLIGLSFKMSVSHGHAVR